MLKHMKETNIEITQRLREYLKLDGYDCGWFLSRKRTIWGESWEEMFNTNVDPMVAIDTFIKHDNTLKYDGVKNGFHIVKNCDARLKILLEGKKTNNSWSTNVFVRYVPNMWSLR